MLEGLGKGVKGAANAGKKAVSALVSPFQGILSDITNFLKFTLLGILINKGLAWFSDPENQKKIANFGRFLKDWWPSLLAGFALFFTPLGSLVSGVVNLLIWAIPKLVALIAANPWVAGGALLAGGLMLGAKALDGDFNKNKKLSEPKSFESGGQVLGPRGKDVIPAMLTNEEFVVSAPAVNEFGPGIFALMNAMGGGTNKPTVKDGTVFAEGGGLVDIGNMYGQDNWMKPWQSDGGSSQWLPAKSKGMVAVPPRVRPKSPELIELPTKVTDLRKSKKVISGTTIPQFKITTNSPMRSLIKINLGLED